MIDENVNVETTKSEVTTKSITEDEKWEGYLKVHLDSLTIHGLPRVFTSPTLASKLVWLVLFCWSCVGFGMFAVEATKMFMSHAAQRKTELKYEAAFKFPSVTICNMRKLFYLNHLSNVVVSSKSSADETFHNYFGRSNNQTTRPLDLEDFSVGFSHITQAIPDFCIFGAHTNVCNTSLFESTSLIPGCITFNPNRSLAQESVGQQFGFRMLLYINSSRYTIPEQYSMDSMQLGLNTDDFKIAVHEPGAFPDLYNNVVYAEMGQHSQIQLVKKTRSLLSAPSGSQCGSIPIELFPGTYQQSLCYISSIIKECYFTCGDIPSAFRMYFSFDVMPRRNKTSSAYKDPSMCAKEFMKQTIVAYQSWYNCPPECEETSYTLSITSSTWPSERKLHSITEYLSKTVNTSFTTRELKTDFALLSVFFDEFRYYHENEELSYSQIEYLSDLGGQAGLYMGASFFSLLELMIVTFCFILSHVERCFCGRRNRTRGNE